MVKKLLCGFSFGKILGDVLQTFAFGSLPFNSDYLEFSCRKLPNLPTANFR